jgi:hypothetical protein
MMTKIPKGGASRAGSCNGLVTYLEKEQEGQWISQEQEGLSAPEVVAAIDDNKRDLSAKDDKYYQVVISPSHKELAHLGGDPQALTAFVRAAMEQYAANFGKGLDSADLVWFAKVEHTRSHTHQERAVQLGEIAPGTPKEGPQTHIHVLVSRMENLRVYQAKKAIGALPLTAQGKPRRAYKLSPLTHHQDTEKGAVQGGFGRNAFSAAVESQFDQQFGYKRLLTESFRYLHTMKHGSEGAKTEMQQLAESLSPSKAHRSDISEAGIITYQTIQKSRNVSTGASNELGDVLGKVIQRKDAADLEKTLAKALAALDAQRKKPEREKSIQPLQKIPSKRIKP